MARRKEPIYGLKLEDGQEILDKREIRVIKIIKDCCLNGMSLKDIAEYLDFEGLTRRYKLPWRPVDISEVLREKKYVDLGIITKEEFELIRRIIKRKEQKPNSQYILTGLLFCKKCGSPFVGWGQKNRKGEPTPKYICNTYKKKGRQYCSQVNLDQIELDRYVLEEVKKAVRHWVQSRPKDKPITDDMIEEAKDIFEKLDKELENLKDSSLNAYIDRPYLEKSQFDHIITNLTNMIREKEKEREEAYLNYRLLEENKLRRGDIDHYINELLNLDLSNKDRSAIILHMFIESIWAEDQEIHIKYRFEI